MTNIQIFDIFPTTIYSNKFYHHEKYKKAFYDVYSKYDYPQETILRNGEEWYNTTSENTGNPYIHLDENLTEIFDEIIENVKKYVYDILEYEEIFDFIITKSWLSRARAPHENINWHDHANSDISFTYYLNTPPNSHRLRFSNDSNLNGLLGGLNKSDVKDAVRNTNIHNASTFHLEPKEGTLILFPSSLAHSTDNARDFVGERLAIAGDVILVFKEDATNDFSMGYLHPKYWKLYEGKK
jgi:hypothetical protein|tara:strand:- start:93 stop:812 length:720 start_codon:yes stop_codon:yes gene_type:complete